MIEKPKVLKCTLKVLENLSTFEMYLSTSTSTDDFPEMYLSTFQVLYKLYLSTDELKYKVLLPGSDLHRHEQNVRHSLTYVLCNCILKYSSEIHQIAPFAIQVFENFRGRAPGPPPLRSSSRFARRAAILSLETFSLG